MCSHYTTLLAGATTKRGVVIPSASVNFSKHSRIVRVTWLGVLSAVVLLIAVLITGRPSPLAGAQANAPELTFVFPQDGDVFGEPLKFIQMCFVEPINNKDLDKGGDFKFSLLPPGGPSLGMRIVFQPDARGLAIYPGDFESAQDGEWMFTWRVTDADSLEPQEGTIRYSVREGGNPPLQPTPEPCTAASTPAPPQEDRPTPTPVDETDDGPDVLKLALFTIGAAGAAAVVALIGYAVRNRVGFWLHRPPERKDGDSGEHH